jgi:hypothetical protein
MLISLFFCKDLEKEQGAAKSRSLFLGDRDVLVNRYSDEKKECACGDPARSVRPVRETGVCI